MADQDPRAELADDLYAFHSYLNVHANADLLDAIQREQLSFTQLRLLERLRGGRRRPTIRQAAATMYVTPAGASRIIDSLAQRGLIRRDVDDDDFRSKRIIITDRGEQAIARLHAVRRDHVHTFVRGLDADELEQLRAAMRPMLAREPIAACRPQPTTTQAAA